MLQMETGKSKMTHYSKYVVKKHFQFILLLLLLSFSVNAMTQNCPVDYVNPLVGTVDREYLSCCCPALGHELLDGADREDGRRMGLYLWC